MGNILKENKKNSLYKMLENDKTHVDLWSLRFINFLNSFSDDFLLKALNLDPLTLKTIFDLGTLDVYAKDSENDLVKEYLNNLPGYGLLDISKNTNINAQHLFIMMRLSSYLYLKSKDMEINSDSERSFEFQGLNYVFNIIDKSFPNEVSFELWFKGILS